MIKSLCLGFYRVYGDFPFTIVSLPLYDLIQNFVKKTCFLKKQ